ncbi:hypothetical protein TIFTF001_014156 [Ficus carica]|uniref:Uncharacterized protein n=1 Tax=Ficus carica TaxID=3494 RepID=A0AA88AJ43_FICCA|nr:hypothetical protein TIFTF001_014156 [Ficus carica]
MDRWQRMIGELENVGTGGVALFVEETGAHGNHGTRNTGSGKPELSWQATHWIELLGGKIAGWVGAISPSGDAISSSGEVAGVAG